MSERVSETDLHAYVDGQLDMARRIEVEAYLQQHPRAATLVMEELKLRDELRLFLADETWVAPPATVELARRLDRRLGWRSFGLRLRRGVAAVILLGLGWFAHVEFSGLSVEQVAAANPIPAFVDEAAEAYQAARLELATGFAPHPGILPLTAHHSSGLLPVPMLSGELEFLGSDLVPWDGGTAVLALYTAGQDQVVTLFAAEVESFDVAVPQATVVQGLAIVFWQAGHAAYVLSGDLPEADLLAFARTVAS